MRTKFLVGAALLGLSAMPAMAETTVIHRDAAPVVDRTVTTGAVEHKTVTRTEDGTGCGSKTVHKEDGMGNSKTVHKEGC